VITANSPAAKGIPPNELKKREESYNLRKQQLSHRPDLFLSKTRLSVINLPSDVDDKALKRLAISAVDKFKKEVKEGKREPLSAAEREEGWKYIPKVYQAKVVRSKDRVDPRTGEPKSTGFSFVEFAHHAHALAALRYLNNNPHVFPGKNRRLIVEFAIENAQILKRRAERQQRRLANNRQNEKGMKRKSQSKDTDRALKKKRTGGRSKTKKAH
jgi:nucleolar protein 4